MPSSPSFAGVPEYGLAIFLDVVIEPDSALGGGRGKENSMPADPMVADLREALKDLARSLFDPYWPELHYMRRTRPQMARQALCLQTQKGGKR